MALGAEEELLVVIFKVGIPQADGGARQAGVVGATKQEAIAFLGTASGDHALIAGFVTDFGLENVTCSEGEIRQVLGHQLHTGVGLLIQAPVSVGQDRVVAVQRTHAQLIFSEAHFEGRAQNAELIGRFAIIQREHTARVTTLVGLVVEVTTGVQLQTIKPLQVQTKTNRTFGVTGLEVEFKALAPIANAVGLGVAIDHIATLLIEVTVKQGKIGVTVIDKVCVC